jgi:hypothetical protein
LGARVLPQPCGSRRVWNRGRNPAFMVSIQDLVVHDCTFCHRRSFDLNHLCTLKRTLHPVYDISANLKNYPSCLRSTQEVRAFVLLSSKARIWRHLTSLYLAGFGFSDDRMGAYDGAMESNVVHPFRYIGSARHISVTRDGRVKKDGGDGGVKDDARSGQCK